MARKSPVFVALSKLLFTALSTAMALQAAEPPRVFLFDAKELAQHRTDRNWPPRPAPPRRKS